MKKQKYPLYLASVSQSRQQLLMQAGINYRVISHSSQEHYYLNDTLETILKKIALDKITSVQLPASSQERDVSCVLAADTMGLSQQGAVIGKPKNYDQAVQFLKDLRGTGICGTGFCLQKRIWQDNMWHIEQSIEHVVLASYEFDIPDSWIPTYLQQVDYMHISGAISIEGFGAQFLKLIHGSYSAIMGLPIYEVRIALEKLGFFS